MAGPKDGDRDLVRRRHPPDSMADTVVEAGSPSAAAPPDDTVAGNERSLPGRATDGTTIAQASLSQLQTQAVSGRADRTIARPWEPEREPGSARPLPPRLGPYRCERELGRGGMGQVLEAYDPELLRRVAVKVLLDPDKVGEEQLLRFRAEARITAQLQHPCIVPVYDVGRTADGTPFYYVMKKVEGWTLRELIDALRGGDEATSRRWTRHRLLTAFVQVCEAMAYAHERRVLHRDLKPDNIMLGRFGEVLILDWGVARVMGDATESSTRQIVDGATLAATRDGVVIGTPGYMSPEQTRGRLSELDGRSDVWSLGTILYEILTYQPAFSGTSIFALSYKVLNELPPDPRERSPQLEVPQEIAQVCMGALATDRGARTGSAAELAESVRAFLAGAKRRERALELVSEATALDSESASIRERIASLRDEAEQVLRAVRPNALVGEKLPGWELEDEAKKLELRLEQAETEYQQMLRSALTYTPDLPEALSSLASHYKQKHARAEASRDARAATRYEVLLRLYDRGQHATYLSGKGALTLLTHPAGAEVELLRYEEHQRRLVARPLRTLGRTPLRSIELEMGSYLLRIRCSGRSEVRYPVSIGRQQHWDGIAPGEREPTPIYLPTEEELGADDVYVPAGWFTCGGDDAVRDSLPRGRVWVDAFVMSRYPVTNRRYIEFLDDLVSQGRQEESLAHAPRERPATLGEAGALLYGRDPSGGFALRADADGDVWSPDWPVVMVDWHGAMAYCDWLSRVDGGAWRLPMQLEWEKAARGVDGRYYPWGDHLDPTWCCMRDSHGDRMLLAAVDSYPEDESPYGVRGLGGNVMDWCLDLYDREALPSEGARLTISSADDVDDEVAYRVIRGGGWNYAARFARVAGRTRTHARNRVNALGFRPVRSLCPSGRTARGS